MEFLEKGIIFLDRDGVLIKDVDYLSSFEQIEIIDGAVEAVKLFNEAGFYVVVISNQSGVARGYFTLEFVNDSHLLLQNKFRQNNAVINGFYFCPHYIDGAIEEFTKKCNCRKPAVGMIERALRQFPGKLKKSYFIGDKMSDVQTGLNYNIKPVLVKTGYGEQTVIDNRVFLIENNILICENILDAAKKILIN
ncbi:MAG: HAD family hydrolase [Calditrichia bacterium]|nr:HAD family hydrolase [Calditrichia bacterium]